MPEGSQIEEKKLKIIIKNKKTTPKKGRFFLSIYYSKDLALRSSCSTI